MLKTCSTVPKIGDDVELSDVRYRDVEVRQVRCAWIETVDRAIRTRPEDFIERRLRVGADVRAVEDSIDQRSHAVVGLTPAGDGGQILPRHLYVLRAQIENRGTRPKYVPVNQATQPFDVETTDCQCSTSIFFTH